jgi:MerR family copper efflux transcriptional regulator
MNKRTIGRLAEEAGVSVETIRFYERSGLLRRPPASGSGWRVYGDDAVWAVRYTRLAQKLGFSLAEIKRLGSELKQSGNFCGNFREALEKKLEETVEEVERLTSIKVELERTLASCRAKSGRGECPITRGYQAVAGSPGQDPRRR